MSPPLAALSQRIVVVILGKDQHAVTSCEDPALVAFSEDIVVVHFLFVSVSTILKRILACIIICD